MDNSIGSLLWQAVTIMFTGMGVVFLFLTILVYLVSLISKLVPQETLPETPTAPSPSQHSNINSKTIAAISAAVHLYRSKPQK